MVADAKWVAHDWGDADCIVCNDQRDINNGNVFRELYFDCVVEFQVLALLKCEFLHFV